MPWYLFYFFYIFFLNLALGIQRRKNRLKKANYIKINYKLLKKKKDLKKNIGIINELVSKPNEELLKKQFRAYYKRNNNIEWSKNENNSYNNLNKTKNKLNAMSTFVSKYYKININDVYNYLNRKKYEYIETDVKITLKYCPFCPPHKYKYDNMYKHEIFKNTGNSYCHRCGYKGSFYDFKLKMGDLVTSNFESPIVNDTYEEEKITFNDVKVYNMNLLYSKEAENARNYLMNERKINFETLKKYYIGFSVMEFQSLENSGKFEKHECLVFPFIRKITTTDENENNCKSIYKGAGKTEDEGDTYEVVRIKVRSLKDKAYMRLYPKNVRSDMKLFFFGDHLITDSDEVVLTEGEIDAMTIFQETNYPAISLPNGSKSLPIYLLPHLEKYKKIHLWLDFDKAGKSSVFNFVNKIGLGRTNVITDANVHYLNENSFKIKRERKRKNKVINLLNPNSASLSSSEESNADASSNSNAEASQQENSDQSDTEKEKENDVYFIDNGIMYIWNKIFVKDANDCLKNNIDVQFFIKNSEKVKHSQILNFNDLRQHILEELKYPDRINGVRSKTIPSLNKFLYGLRMGELSIWTGSTGVGKTTLLSQLSLDYCIQGVSTLWGSFEINNIKLAKVMLNQFCGKNLEKNIDLFDLYADKFELLPLKFLKFHGSTNIDQVLDAMDYAVYAYDVKHIIIDNLQFMLNINKFSDIYELQNIAIDKFRSFSTNKNVHITLVVHPRKEDNNLLSISSVFGSVKSTQEADNVFIIQRQISKNNEAIFFIDIKKNRFKGSLGRIPYLYNKENMTIKEMPINYLNDFLSNNSSIGGSSSNNYLNKNGSYSNVLQNISSASNNNMDFTLCDEYDYMKQLSDEYESKHAFRRYNNKTGKCVADSGGLSLLKSSTLGSGTRRGDIFSEIKGNGKNAENEDIEKEKEKCNPKMTELPKQNDEKVAHTKATNNSVTAQSLGSNEIRSKEKNTKKKSVTENVGLQNNDSTNLKGGNKNSDINTDTMNNKNVTKGKYSSYLLSNDGLEKLCKELKEDDKEKFKNVIISMSMRNCVINNNSPIKDIRNFIKVNKLNIKTSGNNLKKKDVFINVLQSIPKEYISITEGDTSGSNDSINGTQKETFSGSQRQGNMSINKNTGGEYSNMGSMDEEGDNNGIKNDMNNEMYDNQIEARLDDEITKKYMDDNIINVDGNIVKKCARFKLINDKDNTEIEENLYYYEPEKNFNDNIETRFFIINDKNYNEKINYIYNGIKYCGLDMETTGLEVFGEKIRLIQIAVENYPVIIYDMFNITNNNILDGLRKILNDENIVKIIQNGKFDTKFLLYNNFNITNIFDTYIASKLLDKNKNMYGFKLNNIVEKYLSVYLDKQQQNSVWNNSLLNNNQLFYAARDSSCLLKLYKKLSEQIVAENMQIVNDIENKCILPICDMELNGITVDLESLNKSTDQILDDLNVERDKLKKELKNEDINVNSQQQILKALQDNNVRDSSNKLIDNTSDANLKNFINHNAVALLRNYRKLYKLYSAFYLKLPLHINKQTNKIHTTFNQLKTFSGRFSSEKPNLQQIPRQQNIREIFIPSENNIFIIADFKQIELKIAAEITNDEIMLKAYNNNIDLHTLTASIITKKGIDEINKEDRHVAKAINFGLLYGMNYVNLRTYANTYYNVKMNLDQCLYFYNSFFEHYKGLSRWHNSVKQTRALEYSTLSNRKVVFPYFSFTKALNYPVQGTCADILKLALVELYKNLRHINGKIILCVHDEIIIEVDKKHQEEALKILVESMESSASFFLKKVKCEVSAKIAQNWGKKE
ncbi:plastid replication-repair enzyme, putative [Plasmodium chabaudi chabaudi]|uniref:Plastid replication-repair enzyme, putative n=1 Tax=Plasmodium chabaudi chabaudi TaxID=31271 RepID=A0A1D3LFI9_PLACU|nr:plastid replication-repair enzyme, putative [Plasmodium chabaudi chabaudi]